MDGLQADDAVGVHHGAAIAGALRIDDLQRAADPLHQVLVRIVLFQVPVELPLLFHVGEAERQILRRDQIGLVEMAVMVREAAALLDQLEEFRFQVPGPLGRAAGIVERALFQILDDDQDRLVRDLAVGDQRDAPLDRHGADLFRVGGFVIAGVAGQDVHDEVDLAVGKQLIDVRRLVRGNLVRVLRGHVVLVEEALGADRGVERDARLRHLAAGLQQELLVLETAGADEKGALSLMREQLQIERQQVDLRAYLINHFAVSSCGDRSGHTPPNS